MAAVVTKPAVSAEAKAAAPAKAAADVYEPAAGDFSVEHLTSNVWSQYHPLVLEHYKAATREKDRPRAR